MGFKLLTDEELSRLSSHERRAYLKQKKEFDNQKLVADTLSESVEENVKPESAPVYQASVVKTLEAPDTKKSVGRPKKRDDNENYSQIHINLPESLKIRAQQAITCRRTNMNSYIISLIEKDMKENGEDYDSLYRSLAKFS